MFGWAGKILRVDLSQGKIVKQSLNREFAVKFIGGRGFNSKVIYDEFDPEIKDPYSPENIVCIAPGLLSGTAAPSCGRLTVSVARSPITGLFGDGNCGGHFGPELKCAGYDQIIIKGRASRPVWLWIDDDNVEIKDAIDLWGRDTWETTDMIKEMVGDPDVKVFCIGPAGENLVAMAIPIASYSRAPGGCGTGAVWGSKNLKAIAVRGTKGVELASPSEFLEAAFEAVKAIKKSWGYETLSTLGTSMLQKSFSELGYLPTLNWKKATWEDVDKVCGEELLEKYNIRNQGCFNCPISCGHIYRVSEGPLAGTSGHDLEYEALDGFGARCGISYLPAVLACDAFVDRMGLDVVQTSNVICTSMHWWDEGLIDETDTDGLILEWGNYKAALELLRKIVKRDGYGGILADNIFNAAEKIAKKKGMPVEKLTYYIIHAKKMTFSSSDIRSEKGVGLAYAVSTRGGDHLRGEPATDWAVFFSSPEQWVKEADVEPETAKAFFETGAVNPLNMDGKAFVVVYFEHVCALADALEICKFITPWWGLPVGFGRMSKFMTLATGVNYTRQDAIKCAERIYNVEKVIQVRYGLRRKDDYPSQRLFEEEIPDGPTKGMKLDYEEFSKALDEYYALRGWDKEGIPTEEKLRELGLDEMVNDLLKRGIIKPNQK